MNENFDTHTQRAYFYSPLSFLHKRQHELAAHILTELDQAIQQNLMQSIGDNSHLFIRHLDWDSNYFSCPTYRIEFINWNENSNNPIENLATTTHQFLIDLSARHSQYYVFAEIPAEDLITLQALGQAGFRLIETRLTYFRDDIDKFTWERRSAVRQATTADIPNLRQVAMQARNLYDRFHADPFFSQTIADEFLATFIENSVNGFADIVLVPNTDENLPNAFLTGKFMPEQRHLTGVETARMILSAVGESRRGWYIRLIAELSHVFKEKNIKLAYMTTQATNRAVIRVWEKLEYKYGRTTHILAIHSK